MRCFDLEFTVLIITFAITSGIVIVSFIAMYVTFNKKIKELRELAEGIEDMENFIIDTVVPHNE